MRGFVPALCAAAMLCAFTGAAWADEVRIGDFAFSCNTPDGKTVKPKFGDISGAYFTDMPGQYEQCLETIKRKIVGCEANTTFASNTENERYPGCGQIFKTQEHA